MKPHITEKSYQLTITEKPVFTFMVSPKENRRSVSVKIKAMYDKDVVDVRFLKNAAKKIKRQGIYGTISTRRKALVQLKKGQTIKVFDIETKEDKKKKLESKKQ